MTFRSNGRPCFNFLFGEWCGVFIFIVLLSRFALPNIRKLRLLFNVWIKSNKINKSKIQIHFIQFHHLIETIQFHTQTFFKHVEDLTCCLVQKWEQWWLFPPCFQKFPQNPLNRTSPNKFQSKIIRNKILIATVNCFVQSCKS